MKERDTTSGLREKKKREAAATIVSVAKRLFAKRGFDAVTVDEIAREANVSRRTFFRYFPTKEDVFFVRRRAQLEALEAALLDTPKGEDPIRTVRRALLSVASMHIQQKKDVLVDNALVAKTPSLLAKDLEWDRKATTLIADALTRGGDRARARLVAGAIVGAIRVVVEEWVESGGERDLLADGGAALDLFSAVMAPLPAAPAPKKPRAR
ncbi:MAG: TetR family transcriptional regulator [Polyangiaceae bacterium]